MAEPCTEGNRLVTEHGGPSYQRVADDLRVRIISGEYEVGSPIPSTPKLEQHYGVSKTVIRQAVDQLRAAGILAGHPGKAVYVQAKPDAAAAGQRDLKALGEQVAGLKERVRGNDELWEKVSEIESKLIELYGKTGYEYSAGENRQEQERRARHG